MSEVKGAGSMFVSNLSCDVSDVISDRSSHHNNENRD